MSKSKNKDTRLGANPLEWIGRDLISKDSQKKSTNSKIKKENLDSKKVESKFVPYTSMIEEKMIQRIKDYAYWNRLKNKDVIKMALDQFFVDKKTKI